jgi:hypothetical protein
LNGFAELGQGELNLFGQPAAARGAGSTSDPGRAQPGDDEHAGKRGQARAPRHRARDPPG